MDYLWYGIGAFIRSNPQYRYLLGPVTLSNIYPKRVIEMLVYFYRQSHPSGQKLAELNPSYRISPERNRELVEKFSGEDQKAKFAQLKSELAHMNLSVPTLHKPYTEVCEPSGVQFTGFNIDANFGDGLIMVDLDGLKQSKRERYID
ncbi:MAG: hypothetical protein ACI89Z_000542 [Porticoccus sp.]